MAYLGSAARLRDCTTLCDAIWRALATDPTEPAVASGFVYPSGALRGGLAAVPQDRRSEGAVCAPTWTGDINGSPTSRVVVSNGVVYLGSSDGNLYAFPAMCDLGCAPSPLSGSARRSRRPPNRAVLVTAHDGTLRALTVDGREM